MPIAHMYNPSNAANTCLWCGKKLQRNSTYTTARREHQHGFSTDTIVTPTDLFGWEGNGFFCTLRCGEAFGLAFAKLGKRLQPNTQE